MDKNEIVALVIVAVATFFAVRYFLGKKGGGCCSKDCFKPKNTSSKKG